LLHGIVFDRPDSFTASLVYTLSCAKSIIAHIHLLANLRPIISSGNRGCTCRKNFLYTKGCTGTIRTCGELMAQVGGLIVLFTTDTALTREALSAAAKILGNPEIAVPRKIQYVETLPLLGTGKTDYVTLKRMAEALS